MTADLPCGLDTPEGGVSPQGLQQAADALRVSPRPWLVLTGAGISTESGIPDFRSPHGVWQRYRPVLFAEFRRSESARREYWRQKCEMHDELAAAVPNPGHLQIAAWEGQGRLRGVVTQNIDRLHHRAGNRAILELHGNALEVACLNCEFRDEVTAWVEQFRRDSIPPVCPDCGAPLKHATISFGQPLQPAVVQQAWSWAKEVSCCMVIGSSLTVYPAADLPRVAKQAGGAKLVIINRESTPLDDLADYVLRGNAGAILTALAKEIASRADLPKKPKQDA